MRRRALSQLEAGGEPWDIGGAVYDNISFNHNAQTGFSIGGMTFSDDGNKLYIADNFTDDFGKAIFQYSMNSAYDINTASYDSKSYDPTTISGFTSMSPHGLSVLNSGTKLFIQCPIYDRVFQFSLTTAYDITTASYDSKNISVASQDQDARDMFFKPDGTKFYIVGNDNTKVFQYSLSSAYDISTASYDNKSLSLPSNTAGYRSLALSFDGLKVYVVDYNDDNIVLQYNLSVAWDISTATYSGLSFDASSQINISVGIAFNDEGTKMFLNDVLDHKVFQYSL